MNVCEGKYQQMVVITTLVEGRNVASLSVKYPFHGFAGRAQTYHVVLRVVHVRTLLDNITKLLGVLLQSLQRLVLADILAEVVICLGIGVLREVNSVLHDGHIKLVDEVFAVGHLQHNVTAGERKVLRLTGNQSVKGIDVLLSVRVDAL